MTGPRFCGKIICCGLLIAVSLSLLLTASAVAAAGDPNQQEPAHVHSEIERQKSRLSATEVEERRDAVMRLGALNRPDALRLVIPALSDPASIVRVAAAHAVRFLPVEESTPALIPLLNDQDPFVRQEVSYALGSVRSRLAVTPLVERLHADKDNGVRGAAAVALGMIGDEQAVVALAQTLSPAKTNHRSGKSASKDNSFILRAAARSLGQIKSRAGVPALIEVLGNDLLAPDIRREAAESLGLIADPSAVSALRAASLEHDPRLSSVAFAAMRNIESAAPGHTP